MLVSINRLREVAHCLRSGQRLDDDLGRWLGHSLDKFLSQQSASIDEALGIKFDRGGVPWWREEAIRKRNAALQALADYLTAASCITSASREVHKLSIRYAASAWRFDRSAETMPQHYLGTAHEHLWHAFKSGAPMPIGERQLRTILC